MRKLDLHLQIQSISVASKACLLSAAGDRLRPNAYSHSSIRNLYLDTPDFRLIRRSLEKPVYKEKLRLRSYGQADGEHPVFMELKAPGAIPLWMVRLLTELGLYKTSFSKYGTAYQMMLEVSAERRKKYA